jgi:hypothetical protein
VFILFIEGCGVFNFTVSSVKLSSPRLLFFLEEAVAAVERLLKVDLVPAVGFWEELVWLV